MKNLSLIKKIAIKVMPGNQEPLLLLPELTLMMKGIIVEPGLTVYELPGGTTLELYGVGSHYPEYLFSNGNIALSYRVTDLAKTLAFFKTRGAKLLGEVENICSDCSFCYIMLENSSVIGLYQDK